MAKIRIFDLGLMLIVLTKQKNLDPIRIEIFNENFSVFAVLLKENINNIGG